MEGEGGRGTVRGRRIASLVLTVLGTLFLFVGGIALYAREEVFEADAFAQHASDALGDERVDTAIANPLVDKVIASGPDELINARPLLSSAAQGVLETRPFRDAFKQAAARVHRQLFSRDRDALILNIADAGAFVIDGVNAISPQTAKKVPKDLQPRLIELTKSDFAIGAVRASESVRFLGLFLPGLGVLLLAGSVAVAPDRRRAIVTASAAVAIAAAVGVILLVVGRTVLLGQFDDDVTHDAVDAVWGNFLDGLRTWFLGVGIFAIVLAAAASTIGAVDVAAPARRVWSLVTRTPKSTPWRAIRGVALLAASAFVVLRPDLALNIVAVVLGAYGLFLAVSELLLLIAPRPAEAPERVPLGRRIDPRGAVVGAAVLAAAVAIGVALVTDEGGLAKRPRGPVEACNGYPDLCDRPLNEVAFPGAHNAMSAANADFITPNQETKIKDQLDAGIRVLLVDAYYGIKRSTGPVLTDLKREQGRTKVNETISEQFGKDAVKRVQDIQQRVADSGEEGERGTYFCHIVCELGAIPLTKTLTDVREFLDSHPDEFLIMVIEDYIDPADVEAAFKDSGLVRYAYVHDRDTPFPTLRELIESDKRILVMAEKDNGGGSIPWYHDAFELMQETPFTFHSADELRAAASCKPNRGGTDGPLLQFNHWVEKLPRSPDLGAQVNAYDFLIERARECRRRRGLAPNLIAVDFYDEGDLFEASRKLNRLPRDAKPQVRETG
ncbi:MAG TPA: hypothetical protein VE401_04775 [Solirubrobacterales bacterium]|jgi:uncharacterized membrane protein HdeD (DUF308 family)|nr:hypothetical protein [Solirubrobacterales bacterium]